MWYCEDCDITLSHKKAHLKTAKHINNSGGNAYENGKIYKIVSLDDESKVYIGSTYMTLEERYKIHKKQKRAYDNGPYVYVYSYDILDNSKIELIEHYPCDNERELAKREQ